MTPNPAPADSESARPDVVVFETVDETALAIAESLLREAGIPVVACPSASGGEGGYRMYGTALHQLRARSEDADDARALLADLAAPNSPSDAGKDAGSAGGAAVVQSRGFSVYQGRSARRALWLIAITMLMFAVLAALAQFLD